MLLLIACLIACRLIRNHFAVPVREVAMLTSSSCRTRVCCARSVLCRWRAGRSLVGGVRLSLGPSLNLWALPCLPRAAVWSCACSVVLRDAGPPLARRGCRVMGWWLSAPPLPQWRGRGFPCASHLCGVGLRTEVGGVVEGRAGVAVRATWISRECLPRTVTSAPLVCIVERQSGLALAFCGRMR